MKMMVVGSCRALALVVLLVVGGCSSGRQFQPGDGGPDQQTSTGGAAGKGSGGAGAAAGGHAGAAAGGHAGGDAGGHAGGGAGGHAGAGGVPGSGGAGGGGAAAGAGGQGTGGAGGTGPTKSENGTTCTLGNDCVSGNCVDKICCGSACTGICQSCKLTATGMPDGMCANVSSGKADPSATCLAAAANSCGETGTCDGHGGCAFQGSSTICLAAACSGGSFTPASTCDGTGKCVAGTPTACNGFSCTAAAGCATTCASDTDCTGGYCASTKTCAAKMTNGSTCSANDQCSSNFCVGNICCENACGGLCQSCSGTDTGQSSGLCKPITAGGGSKGRCTAAGTTCGLDGTCDGNGACRFGASGTSCGSTACASAVLTGAPTCNGSGTCVTPTTTAPCPNLLVCASTTTCKASCTADSDCVSGNYCASGTCTGVKATGSTCSASDQCSSANCRDSICCPASCTLSCQGCASSVTGSTNGTCALRTSNPAGTQVCNNVCTTVNGTDANNCGSCGHGCLGGTCSAGACQPLLLGTVPGPSQYLILSGGFLYAVTATVMVQPLVYQMSSSAPSTPALVAGGLAAVASPSCIMDNKVFWTQVNTSPSQLKWCTLGNCAATTATLTTTAGQAQQNPVCDTSTDEIVWDDYQPQCSGCNETIVTIYRMSANGTNKRTMTSFFALSGTDYYSEAGFISFRPDRFFFSRETYSTMNQVLYYVSTTSAGTSPISIGSGSYGQNGFNPPGNNNTAWANDTMFVWNDSSGFSQISYDLPLPNGLTTAPPVFYSGYLGYGSIVDNQKFYGTFSTLPSDAIGTCSVSNCTNPTAMFRGQSGASALAEDSTAIYWITGTTTGTGFNVWKGAK